MLGVDVLGILCTARRDREVTVHLCKQGAALCTWDKTTYACPHAHGSHNIYCNPRHWTFTLTSTLTYILLAAGAKRLFAATGLGGANSLQGLKSEQCSIGFRCFLRRTTVCNSCFFSLANEKKKRNTHIYLIVQHDSCSPGVWVLFGNNPTETTSCVPWEGHLFNRKPAPDPAAPKETSSGARRDRMATLWRHPSAGRRDAWYGVVWPSYHVSV